MRWSYPVSLKKLLAISWILYLAPFQFYTSEKRYEIYFWGSPCFSYKRRYCFLDCTYFLINTCSSSLKLKAA